MNGNQIDKVVQNIGRRNSSSNLRYIGVLPVEDLHNVLFYNQTNVFFILNVLPREIKMGHWIVVCLIRNVIYVFDSFNVKLEKYGLHLNYTNKKITYCTYRLQSRTSLVCGFYCIWFVQKLKRYGIKYAILLNRRTFSRTSYLNNDKKVTTFVYQYFGNYLPRCNYLLCHSSNIDIVSYNTCNYICSSVKTKE